MCWIPKTVTPIEVALRKESVDRNAYGRINDISRLVALRKESVDRNTFCLAAGNQVVVALRKESVDRNMPIPLAA